MLVLVHILMSIGRLTSDHINCRRLLDDIWTPTTDFGLQPVVGPLANQNECDHTIFLVTVIADGSFWFLVVGDKSSRRWSANGRTPSVTGPYHDHPIMVLATQCC